jgi:hypothetical protein
VNSFQFTRAARLILALRSKANCAYRRATRSHSYSTYMKGPAYFRRQTLFILERRQGGWGSGLVRALRQIIIQVVG